MVILWVLVSIFGFIGAGTLTLWLYAQLKGPFDSSYAYHREDLCWTFFFWWIYIFPFGPQYIAKKIGALK